MKIKLIFAIIIPLLFVGCDSIFDEGDVEKKYNGPAQLGFFPLEQEVSVGSGNTTIEVQLIGKQRDSNLTVNFSASGQSTAVAGTHYTIATSSPVTLSSGTSTVDIQINLIDGSLAEGEEVRLILTLEGGDGVEAAPNLASSNIYIRG